MIAATRTTICATRVRSLESAAMYICVYMYMCPAHCSTACFLARSFATYRRGGVHHFCRCMGSFAFATLAHSNGYGVENVAGKPDLELVELRVPLFVPAGELLLELCKLRRELSRGVLELGALPPTRVRWLDEPGRLDARLHDPVGKEPEKPVERQKGSIGWCVGARHRMERSGELVRQGVAWHTRAGDAGVQRGAPRLSTLLRSNAR